MRLRDPAGPGLLKGVVRFQGGYLVPRGDGRYVLGATMEERGFEPDPTAGGIYELLRDAHELVPGVSELRIEEIGVGYRPGTPDNLPLIGAGALEGLTWATGHYRNGILLAPFTAELVTRLWLVAMSTHEPISSHDLPQRQSSRRGRGQTVARSCASSTSAWMRVGWRWRLTARSCPVPVGPRSRSRRAPAWRS